MMKFGKSLSALGLTLVMLFWTEIAFATAELSSMRVGQVSDKTRVVFDLKQAKDYKVFQLNNPSRIVVDFFDTDNSLSFSNKVLTDSRLFKIRVADKPKRVRVVLDLHKSPNFKVFMLGSSVQNNQRLVVDLLDQAIAVNDSKTNTPTSNSAAPAVADKSPQENNVSENPPAQMVDEAALKAEILAEIHAEAKALAKSQAVAKDKQTPQSHQDVAKQSRVAEAKNSDKKPTASNSLLPAENAKQPLVAMNKAIDDKALPPSKATQSLLNQESAVLQKPAELVIAIDAGHGGKDTGAIGHNKVYEKHATLAMAQQMKAYIDKQPGMKAVLTRDKDVFISLSERVKIAKQKQADIFISIHADAFHDSSVRGGSVYVLSERGASSTMARLLAKSENAAVSDVTLDGMDDDLAFVLSDLSREANIKASHKLAKVVLGEMQKTVKMHKHSVQSAGFAVLKSIDMPSLLIETAFISNPHEARNLMNQQFQRKMASAIVDGLAKYRDELYPQQRWGDTLYVHYKVQSGDTLSQIAVNYNVTTKQLKKINNIKNANELYVGRKLKIPVSKEVLASL